MEKGSLSSKQRELYKIRSLEDKQLSVTDKNKKSQHCLPTSFNKNTFERMTTLPIDPSLQVKDSSFRAAIPILPLPAAIVCFVFNLMLPGTGAL